MNQKPPADKPALKPYKRREPIVRKVSEIDFSGTYSYANYLRWAFDERLEIIKGEVFDLTAPSTIHQRTLREISGALYVYLKRKQCEVFIAPFDVRLAGKSKKDEDIFTVVQPDICVICDQQKIDSKGCLGAPDLVVEILSRGNKNKEMKIKYNLYQEFGVREYWIVNPAEKIFLRYIRNNEGVFVTGKPYTGETEFASDVLPGFRLNIAEVFG